MSIYSSMDDLSSARRTASVRLAGLVVGLWAFVGVGAQGRADPIPKGEHDRRIDIRLTPEAVVVKYQLNVEPFTAHIEDVPTVAQGGDFENIRGEDEYFRTFARLFGPHLAGGLEASLDGKGLTFRCVEHRHQLIDPQNHLRCEFVFRAEWKLAPGTEHTLAFREGNYKGPRGQVTLALGAGLGIRRVVPRLPLGPDLSSDERARQAKTVFRLSDGPQNSEPEDETPAQEENGRSSTGSDWGGARLLELLFDSQRAFWVLLLSAAIWGAGHALSPGHGKTLVAAYLVGERGTIAHALFLGLVTTLTHTGIVLLVALGLWLKYPQGIPPDEFGGIQQVLELAGGLLIAGVGLWLFFRRLAGKADHVHFGGGHHHHHHGHHHHHHYDHDHTHDHDHPHDHDHVHPVPGGWRGLVALRVGGGIVPCPSAVMLLVAAVIANKMQRAVPLLLAFSAGLASVLVLVGIVVVRTKGLAGKRWERSPLYRALPVVSAALVTCLGLVLCYDSVR